MTSAINATALGSIRTRNGREPNRDPQATQITFDFSANPNWQVTLSMQQARGYTGEPQGMFVDNSGSGQPLTILIQTTNQQIICPAASQGFFPIFAPEPTNILASSAGGVKVSIWITNFAVPAFVWNQGGGSVVSDTGLYALWNAAVAGTGPLFVRDAILEGTVISGKVQVQDAALEAVISGGKVQVVDSVVDTNTATIAGAVSAGKMQVQDVALEATISGGKVQVQDTALEATISGGKIQVVDSVVDANTATIATNTTGLNTTISGGKVAVTDSVLEATVISSGTQQLSVNSEGNRSTYSITTFNNALLTTGNVLFVLQGSATKQVRIKKVKIIVTATAASNFILNLGRISAIVPGTPVNPSIVKFALTDAAPTAVATAYSTAQTSVTQVFFDSFVGNLSANTMQNIFDFARNDDKAFILNGVNDYLSVTASATMAAGTVVYFIVEWEEI